jgi:hypothetical protein
MAKRRGDTHVIDERLYEALIARVLHSHALDRDVLRRRTLCEPQLRHPAGREMPHQLKSPQLGLGCVRGAHPTFRVRYPFETVKLLRSR